MDIQAKLNELAVQRANTQSQLSYCTQYVGMTNGQTGASLMHNIDAHIRAVVAHEVYLIVSSPEFFGLTVHGAAEYVDKGK